MLEHHRQSKSLCQAVHEYNTLLLNSKLKLSDLKIVISSSACMPTHTHTHTVLVLLFRLKPQLNRKRAYIRTTALGNGLCVAPQSSLQA